MSVRYPHHSFDIGLAADFSIQEAIIIHHFQHWIRINRELGKNMNEGRTWSYQTQEWIAAHFPYWNKYQVQKIIKKLIDKGVLMVGNYNQKKYDQTNWYAFVNEGKYLPFIDKVLNSTMDDADPHDGTCETAPPIPDSLTYPKTEKEVVCPATPISPEIPSKIKKKTSDGHEIEVCLDDIFRKAIQLAKNWTTEEIMKAWKALYEAARCNDGWRFIEGTIKNIRTKTQFQKMQTANDKQEKKTCQAMIPEQSTRRAPAPIDMLALLSQTSG